jgi:2-dehydro-3-deoxyphosphogalactonate aldolase
MTTMHPLLHALRPMPLIAILRGLDPQRAAEIGQTLVACGFRALEVPLNRPGALACIEALVKALPPDVLIGGGTMCTLQDVDDVHAAGGRLMVSPHCDARLIAHAVRLGMLAVPGVITPTEAFTALQAGAHALKLFPADVLGPSGLKALASVLPSGTDLWPVGGITPSSMAGWVAAGATGFGIGSQLYAPGADAEAEAVRVKALEYLGAWGRGRGS